MKFIRTVFVCLWLLSVSACAMFGDDSIEPPAQLEAIKSQVVLKKIWGKDTGVGVDDQLVNLTPTVANETVFVADRNGSVLAYALEDGKKIWAVKVEVAISSGPGIGDGLVIVGSSNGLVVALSAENGAERWRAEMSSEVLSVPQIEDGVVVVQTVDGQLAGLKAANGDRIWSSERAVPVLTLRGTSTPLLYGGAVLSGFANGKLGAFELSTGRKLWEVAVAIPRGRSELQRIVDVDASAVIKQDVLYVTSYQGSISAISLANGRALWNREMSSWAGIAVTRGQVFTSDENSELWALDRNSGASLWRQDKLRRRSLTGPVVVDGLIGVGDFDGFLHLISQIDGHIVGRIRVDRAGILATPVALDNRLLVLGASGKLRLYQLEALDGS